MSDHDILILGASEVEASLAGREDEILEVVQKAYEIHARGETSLPHSSFLRFPDSDRDRIISLPAYLGGDFGLAGIKWIASVPDNLGRDLPRASAAMILNRRETGRPKAILEGSIISKRRTAASAALAARVLRDGRPPTSIGFIGCGPINFEVGHFLSTVWPEVRHFSVYGLDPERAADFRRRFLAPRPGAELEVASSLEEVLAASETTSFATTTIKPHVRDLSACPANATILHVSLRDLEPAVILAHHNVVDDLDHVCRAGTSIHLTAEAEGNRDFVHGSLGEILLGDVEVPPEDGRAKIFSPFGLGILDLAVASLVERVARAEGAGTSIEGFLPRH